METLNYLYLSLIIIVTLYFGAVTLINYFTFKRCNRFSSDLKEEPAVDVLIPARNEEKNVEKCLETILNQNYENYKTSKSVWKRFSTKTMKTTAFTSSTIIRKTKRGNSFRNSRITRS